MNLQNNRIMLTETEHLHFGHISSQEIAYLQAQSWTFDKICNSLAGLRGQASNNMPTESYIFPDLANERLQLTLSARKKGII